MKIECIKNKLEEVISKTEKITGKNLTLPILKCVLLIAKDNALTIRATNLDLGIEMSIPVKIKKEGVVAVPAGILYNFLTNLFNEKNVSLEAKDNKLIVSTSHTETQIKIYPYEEFPTIPIVSDKKSIIINSNDLILGLKSVWYSASPSSMKPELSSIYIYYDNGKIVFVATDSFRLAEKKILNRKIEEFESVLIPHKNVSEIIRVFEPVNGDIKINLSDNQISFSSNGIYLTSRVIDGTFPEYGQIIPKEHSSKAILLKQDAIGAFKVSNIFSDKFNQVTVEINKKEKYFQITTKNPDIGENIYKIDSATSGEGLEMNFNYKYIIDCFQSMTTDSVSFEMSKNKPMVIKGVGDPSFLYLVMPMNR
ncbi:DNA polymerase III subunit beta [Patescibacteria group bacterium]|nr:DNA polymerase III subunit beta [Patescibacteria group bacterium]MBU4057466.1 DNA polymerase III subunit beta [Patescibacteria group bacterium]MBU4115665.1 DNA polymerase III subunit beta [Patescibacteria group bacterium]